MIRRYRSSQEELNIEKIVRLERSNVAEDEFDELADQIKKKDKVEELKESLSEDMDENTEDSTDDTDSDTEDTEYESSDDNEEEPAEDSETDSEEDVEPTEDEPQDEESEDDKKEAPKEKKKEEEPEEEDQSDKDEEAATAAAESYHALFQHNLQPLIAVEAAFVDNIALKLGIATEGNFFYNHLIQHENGEKGLLVKGGQAVGEKALEYGKILAELGIDYGKVALKHVAKGLLAAITGMYRALVNGSKMFVRYVFKRIKNYKKYKNKIAKAQQLLSQLQVAEKPEHQYYENKVVIFNLKAGTDLDFDKHLKALLDLNSHYNDRLIEYAKNVVIGVRMVIRSVMADGYDIPLIDHIDQLPLNGFKLSGPQAATDVYHYSKFLPGDHVFEIALPNKKIKEYAEIKAAYHHSRSRVIKDGRLISQNVKACEYLDVKYMQGFLEHLASLCDKGIELQNQFKQVEKYKSKLKPDLESYIKFIVSNADHMTVKESLAEFIALKTHFLDAVVIAGSMHIHDLNVSVLSNGLTAVRDSMKYWALK